MQIGMIGLGRMGKNMAGRLLSGGHRTVALDRDACAVQELVGKGAVPAHTVGELIGNLTSPRAIWLMLPAVAVDRMIEELTPLMSEGDILVDGGNSYFEDDIRRAVYLRKSGIDYLDVGTSGGIWGKEQGYCLMIGGDRRPVEVLDPIFRSLAPGLDSASRTPGREGVSETADRGYLHCGPSGAGHFVKMVHNGIEYGLMAAYAEGLNILRHADAGRKYRPENAETAPLSRPERFRYEFNLAEITEVWRRGSVVRSWLLDLAASALTKSPDLSEFKGAVSDSGEGRWTLSAAVETGTPVPVLSAALFERYASRGEQEFANKVLSALRFEFGGHGEGS